VSSQQWKSKLGFILASAGSAIGLGAIWKFPYMTGMGGGGAFFLLFLLFTLLFGMPLLLAEFVIGRSTQKEAISAYETIAPNTFWPWIGKIGVFACFLLLSFYSVVGGWIIIYLFYTITGQLWNRVDNYDILFAETIANPVIAISAQLFFIVVTAYIVSKGVQAGIEKASKYLMPALFVLFLILIVRSLTLEGAWEGVKFFLQPDFSKITSKVILDAMGQAFFSLSVGVSVMVTYSSYLSKGESLPKSTISIVILTILIALLAGLAIFPAVFAFGLEPQGGPGLLFIVLPAIFAHLPFGGLFFGVFLLLFFFAAITSSISMLEIMVASFTKGKTEKRNSTAMLISIFVFLVGIPSALSYGIMGDVHIMGKTFFDFVDYVVSNIFLPLGGLVIAIFVGYKMNRDVLKEEIKAGSNVSHRVFVIWLFLLRYIVPVAILVVFLNVIGIW
jgi:neurotransmitter:Na+ symporter, NSS family